MLWTVGIRSLLSSARTVLGEFRAFRVATLGRVELTGTIAGTLGMPKRSCDLLIKIEFWANKFSEPLGPPGGFYVAARGS